jgi:hypothetical protein
MRTICLLLLATAVYADVIRVTGDVTGQDIGPPLVSAGDSFDFFLNFNMWDLGSHSRWTPAADTIECGFSGVCTSPTDPDLIGHIGPGAGIRYSNGFVHTEPLLNFTDAFTLTLDSSLHVVAAQNSGAPLTFFVNPIEKHISSIAHDGMILFGDINTVSYMETPEPSSLFLLPSGFLALGYIRRRSRLS